MTAHQLRFISGKYQGGSYPLSDGDQVVMGRGMDAGLTLFEEMVSRHHARFSVEEGAVVVEDLGSKNGTFVNGERVERRQLEVGDRILMGTSILRLEEASSDGEPVQSAAETAAAEVAELEPEEVEQAAALETMVPTDHDFDDLDFDESSLTATTVAVVQGEPPTTDASPERVENEGDEAAKDDGHEAEDAEEPVVGEDEDPLSDAEISMDDLAQQAIQSLEAPEEDPVDGVLLADEVDPFADDDELSAELTVPGDTAIPGQGHMDESIYRQRWGDAPLSVYLSHPMQPSLEFLSPEQLSALQAAHNQGNLTGIAEALRKEDAWVIKTINFLLRSGYLESS